MASVKRNLFTTPSRAKRQKTMGTVTCKSAPMKIPKSLLPETKQFTSSVVNEATGTDTCSDRIPIRMNQGNDSDQFIGSKFRIQRVRVHYDFTGLSLSRGHRIMLVIPKDPTGGSFPISSNVTNQVDTDEWTVLHDQLMSNDMGLRSGTFDWSGPLNVEMNKTGSTPVRNNLMLCAFSAGNGVAMSARMGYSVWFTDN